MPSVFCACTIFCANTESFLRYVPFALFSDKHRQSRAEAKVRSNVAEKIQAAIVFDSWHFTTLGAGPTCLHTGPLSSTPGKMTPKPKGLYVSTLAVSFPIAEEPVPEGRLSSLVFCSRLSKDDETGSLRPLSKQGVNEKPPHDHLPGREAGALEAVSKTHALCSWRITRVLPVLMWAATPVCLDIM